MKPAGWAAADDLSAPFPQFHPASSAGADRPTGSEGQSRPQLLELVTRYLRQRGLRETLFGADLFREPAWDIILDLYCARLSGHDVSIMDACIAAGVPNTTGLRYVRRLVSSGIVVSRGDPSDRRRSWVVLSDSAAEQVEDWLSATWRGLPDAA